jgi:hypothetical protein
MTWNSEGVLCSGRELVLLNLLTANNVDIGIVKVAKIPDSSHGDFNMEEYHSYLPHASKLLKTAKYRVVVLVRSELATAMKIRLDLMHAAVQSVWIQLDLQLLPVQVLVDLWVLGSWSAAFTGSGRTLPGRRPPCPRSGSSCRRRPKRRTM